MVYPIYLKAYALFLPYLISDHCPTVLVIPKSVHVKKKPFKFANIIAGKHEFIPTMNRGSVDEGCRMFNTVKNLKGLKKHEECRLQRNKIDAINDDSGNTYEGVEVADQFVKHFQKFLGESVRVDQIRNMERLIKCKLNAEETSYMVSDKEIKNAMFQIDDNKAPGPDGYTSL
ncbi:hypothetical protein Tco_1494826, partial [Tanacetum coccineum]